MDFYDTPLTNKSTGYTKVHVIEAAFGEKWWPVGTQSPSMLGEFMRITFMYIKKFPQH